MVLRISVFVAALGVGCGGQQVAEAPQPAAASPEAVSPSEPPAMPEPSAAVSPAADSGVTLPRSTPVPGPSAGGSAASARGGTASAFGGAASAGAGAVAAGVGAAGLAAVSGSAAPPAAQGGDAAPATHSGGAADAATPSGAFVSEVPEAGWRWESSLGIELAVPEDWAINDTDCTDTDGPTLVRAQGVVADCGREHEAATKQIVEIMPDSRISDAPRPSTFSFRDITIGSETAERGEGQVPDGRVAGWLHIPGLRVIVDVRVTEQETLQKVLDSVRVVAVDHNHCATARDEMKAAAPRVLTLVPRDTSVFSVCLFGSAVLGGSALITGSDAEGLATALNAATPGRNLDVPVSQCAREQSVPPPDVVLIAHAADDSARVEVTFSSCSHRGMTNGRGEAQVTERMVQAIMKPLHSGYEFSDLPKGDLIN